MLFVWDDPVARDRQVAAVRRALGEDGFAAAWSAGQALGREHALAEGLTEAALSDGR